MLLFGVDVGVAYIKRKTKKPSGNCGVTVYDTEIERIIEVFSGNMWQMQLFFQDIREDFYGYKLGIVLENPNLDKTVFRMSKSKAIAGRKGRDVGKNQAAAMIFIQQIEDQGLPYIEVAPSQRDRAIPHTNIKLYTYPTKVSEYLFRDYTGSKLGTNEHIRDSGTLVFGMTERIFERTLKYQNLKKQK
jgi:hypothetical protein